MQKRLIYAFLVIGITVIILLFNSGDTIKLNLLFTELKLLKSLTFLSFTAIGVLVGVLVK